MIRKRIGCLALCLILFCGICSAFADGNSAAGGPGGKRIGIQMGSVFDHLVLEVIPDAELSYFNSMSDMVAALETGKIDAFPCDEPPMKLLLTENSRLASRDAGLEAVEYGAVFTKTDAGETLRDEFNGWLANLKASGELDRITVKWTEGKEADKTLPDYASFPATRGTLVMLTAGTFAPMNYFRGEEIVGMDVELAALFCEAKGYGLTVGAANFEGILSAIQTGKADFSLSSFTITEERKQSILFSDPYYSGHVLMAVMKKDAELSALTQEQLKDKRIGVMTGSVQVMQVEKLFPNAKLFYFNSDVDMLSALRAGKIDAYASAIANVKYMMAENPDLMFLEEGIGETMDIGAVFPKTDKGRELCAEFNAFLSKIKENGVQEEIQNAWFGVDESRRLAPDLESLKATKGTLRMATDATIVPFVYLINGEPAGIDIETVYRFCEEYGYGLQVVQMDFSGIIPSVLTGKVDFASSGIAYTAERAESVLFSDPTFTSLSVLAVLRPQEAAGGPSFWDTLAESFEKTFIREERWKLFTDGIVTTLVITALAILFGTLLGFGVFMLCRNGNAVANFITRICIKLVQGMPAVVLLMILYYIIFGNVSISGVVVAVIGFTLTFGSSVYSLLKLGVGTIEKGQYEAAYALGCSRKKTFFKIILPQALPHVLPPYQGEIVSLIKATSIVGYIAVQDLTKMGDIVRSRTYEAFFPLIAITVIYFLLEDLLAFFVGRIQIRVNPRRRTSETVLKGVNRHD